MTLMIGKHSVVSLNYTLKNDAGEVVDTSEGGEPLSYLHGAGNLIQGLEAELEGKMTGSSFNVSIAPDQAYGKIRQELIQTIDKGMFQGVESIEPGMSFMAQGDGGQQQRVVVTAVEGEQVTIDANHPMAGQNLHFEVEVLNVRDATEQEIEHGHVHSGGHDH